jgi:hypothetical protein
MQSSFTQQDTKITADDDRGGRYPAKRINSGDTAVDFGIGTGAGFFPVLILVRAISS